MFSRLLSINPPEPELLFDVKRENKANSDYPDGYPSLHDFSHNNCFATYQNGILKSPELYYNPWNLTASNRCEAVELKTGVCGTSLNLPLPLLMVLIVFCSLVFLLFL